MTITETDFKDLLNSDNLEEQFNFLPGFLDWIKSIEGIYPIFLQLKQKQMEGGNKNSKKKKKKRKKRKSTKLSKKKGGAGDDEGWIDPRFAILLVLAAFFFAVSQCVSCLDALFPPPLEFAEEPMPARVAAHAGLLPNNPRANQFHNNRSIPPMRETRRPPAARRAPVGRAPVANRIPSLD